MTDTFIGQCAYPNVARCTGGETRQHLTENNLPAAPWQGPLFEMVWLCRPNTVVRRPYSGPPQHAASTLQAGPLRCQRSYPQRRRACIWLVRWMPGSCGEPRTPSQSSPPFQVGSQLDGQRFGSAQPICQRHSPLRVSPWPVGSCRCASYPAG